MARPKKDIDPDKVFKMASIGCTNMEIAHVMGCHHDTLTNRFREQLDAGRADGKASLRRKQFDLAMSGNAVMLIWLGKQLLGQSDKVATDNTNQTKITIDLMDGGASDTVDVAEIITRDKIN